ncbi:MAG: protein-L-isoaspartate(D-aspartate) O-methyltransferase [Gemmatimonadales bacterium]|nr:protein-L-isoaspartate(D-aspartate) O-methyltransferase [Gemmatimonadales bacterium]NIN11984.1 protein-L-isoaspartate(D-aspartate) O-methyltransferase [Gemmatimonadales bacterium]NIN50519.1 protein-L-isoaspartate(D-aspartate) O-methyltransferase [Gemmatimonadales bacterium]NIP07983.1 protein-L-isoaspartate(D-aspartate) O-methyltransferase [Gemmatimonadales bacterium]NIR00574.1 protein-L-isoaspartate(D-aspartate) O-methyltransferase [Gemmatimonadales bacterium]
MATGRLADTYGGYRARLVECLRQNGIRDLAVLRAFGETPRHLFVPEALRSRAYDDVSLPIGSGQTISQPTTQGRYLEALGLQGHERVLEIGTGSGYQAALLSHLAQMVVSVERLPELATRARQALDQAGTTGVMVVVGDGSLGWRPEAPYDAILVAAASPHVPRPLVSQLAEGGRIIIPIQRDQAQELRRVTKRGGELEEERLGEVQFLPLIGKHGFSTNGIE